MCYIPDMNATKIGISDISVYLPAPRMDLALLVEQRVREVPKLERHLARARRATGQRAIRFNMPSEDTSTMAASSAYRLIEQNPRLNLSRLRYLTVGTESGVDHSKPVSAYVEGMLQQADLDIPDSLSSFQVQHACAGGTLSLLSVSALLQAAGRDDEFGIVICSDIARYQSHSTAEVTQGAGSVALLVENDPKLVELDLSTQGYCSQDTDDFFRPLGSKTAQVKGTYSMQCYRDTLESALLDHCERSGRTPADLLADTDLLVLHTPFRNLPESSMTALLARYLGLEAEEARTFLEERGLYDGIDVVAEVGNIYTGAMYLAFAYQLHNQYRKYGDAIVGKRVLFFSYGSGNTMTVFSGRISSDAPEVISRWHLDELLAAGHDASLPEYQLWSNGPYVPAERNPEADTEEEGMPVFTLTGVRTDGYREYGFHERAAKKDQRISSKRSTIGLPAVV